MWRLVKAAGMQVQHVTLLTIANNDLPMLEYRRKTLENNVNSLEEQAFLQTID
jgi:hypothetical protein